MNGKVSWFQYSTCAFKFKPDDIIGNKDQIPLQVKGKVQMALRRGCKPGGPTCSSLYRHVCIALWPVCLILMSPADYSGVSFVDYNLGRLLASVERLRVVADTVCCICLWFSSIRSL